MGDPRKPKKKYSGPAHPWQAVRLQEEAKLIKEYALKNKKEIWKAVSFVKKNKQKAKQLIASTRPQAKKEEKEILARLVKLQLLSSSAKVEDILDIPVNTALERRLQTVVYKKGLARTPAQARQMIIHRHIMINGQGINIPSYMVTSEEEPFISFAPRSKFINEEHPERAIKKKEQVKEAPKETPEEKKEEISVPEIKEDIEETEKKNDNK